MNYKPKYKKYKQKNDDLESLLHKKNSQTGGDNKTLKKLHSIKEKFKEKGLSYWFDENGNILSKNIKKDDAKTKLIKKIYKNVDEYVGNILANVDINFLPNEIGNDERGCLELNIEIVVIKKIGKDIALNIRNDKNSLLRVYYKDSELSLFKSKHLKTIALALINDDIKKTNPFKFYHLEDFEDIF